MKPRIALFGLPPKSTGQLKIWLYADTGGSGNPHQIYQANNDESGKILDYVTANIQIGCTVTIRIMSSGICEYSHTLQFNGADISHVPNFKKEINTSEDDVSKDWDLNLWQRWNANKQHEEGLAEEKQCLMSRTISVVPVWESYYTDTYIDYFEKFQKLWIGLNAYATHWSSETQDKKKILDLVNSGLRQEFNRILSQVATQKSAEKWMTLQQETGVNMTSDIVRDEIASSCHGLDFLEQAKSAIGTFFDIYGQLNGLVFLDSEEGKEIFRNIFRKYHEFMASPEGISQTFNLAEAFSEPRAPHSVKRIGRLIYHVPYLSTDPGNLFSLSDYFDSRYVATPYQGHTDPQLQAWEAIDPLFFRYMHVLYKFRCAYFHGDLPSNTQNNELARTAYQSLHEIMPAIL